MGRLDGRTALVTGGSRGIGEAIATAFVREGARVIITSRKDDGLAAASERITAATGHGVLTRACHVGSIEAIGELFQWLDADVGLVDVVVNNAATNPYFGPMLQAGPSAWDKTFEVNVRGTFEVTRQAARRLIDADQPGSIVNLTSVYGFRGATWQGIYAMTKAAIVSMTQTLAFELGPGIRVNAIAPGLVDTHFASALVEDPRLSAVFTDRSALRRVARPEEIAGLAVFLASTESSFVTGETIRVDGGFLAG